MKAWPFLIGKNNALEFCAVVVPEIVSNVGGRAMSEFADAAFSKVTGEYFHCKWQPSRSGEIQKFNNGKPIDLIFRRIRATKDLVNEGNASETLTDDNGRELYIIEGIALEKNVPVTAEQFNACHDQLIKDYARFWKAEKNGQPKTSASIDLTVDIDESKHLHVTHQPTKYDEPAKTIQKLDNNAITNNNKLLFKVITGVAVGAIIGAALYFGWQWYKKRQQERNNFEDQNHVSQGHVYRLDKERLVKNPAESRAKSSFHKK